MAVVDSLRSGVLNLDYAEVSRRIEGFIADSVEKSRTAGVVVGLSGGVDSSVVATLCVRALSKERVLGLIMPTSFTPQQDILDAEWIASWLGIRTKTIIIDPIVDSFTQQLEADPLEKKLRIPFANLRARVRMTLLYFHANAGNMLVAGTGDRSEILIGYFTKYGDGGVDILPIGGLFKSQVRRLATYLGIPERIAYKPSSPQLYPGHRAVDEIPADYEQLDIILYLLFDKQKKAEEVARETGFSLELVHEVIRRYESSHHKRSLPPVPAIK
ncbi:MAG TPA: NAD+ synthase [Candidatus Caldiarchaeum subterraneum]|uniref:NH(3)-dependent NAD(+) synthetase n=1 Tax=Caldiarchaeum subterraneum TaxID=311458 RepID=A0A832ZYG9_CALS0|nr:NAD+ synthase [Candidatus Caldarchaeum subterraneum]